MDIVRANLNGGVEKFGIGQAVIDQIGRNFEDRGFQAAQLIVATLTETAYAPTIGGNRFGIEVSNIYGEGAEDTVVSATEALQEALAVNAIGMGGSKDLLWTTDTRYREIFKNLLPNRRDGRVNSSIFDEAMVEALRSSDVEVQNPGQARDIVRFAPSRISGLMIDRQVPEYTHRNRTVPNDLLTVDGRNVAFVTKKLSFLDERYLDYMPEEPELRGGKAPSSTIVTRIKNEIVSRRASASKR